MADLVDARQNLEEEDEEADDEASESSTEEDEMTAVEMKKSRHVERTIYWDRKDKEIRFARYYRIENSQKPSMWQYRVKEGLPTELINVDPSTFLISPLEHHLSFSPKNILARICSMLSVRDFLNLSLTCRYLHWRMFTFCTCYAPNTVKMQVVDDSLSDFRNRRSVPPILKYTRSEIVWVHIINGGSNKAPIIRPYPEKLGGRRGLFLYYPFSLRKPFFFYTLELHLTLPFYTKEFYDTCLPYILAVRGLARHLNLTFSFHPNKPIFNFLDTNNFLMAINASYYDNFYLRNSADIEGTRKNVDIFEKCPYARQMYRVYINRLFRQGRLNVSIFENSIGIYSHPPDSAIIATLKNFLTGSANLIFHQYMSIERNNDRFPLIEYLFQQFGEFEEFFYVRGTVYNSHFHIWKKVVDKENGGQLRIIIKKDSEYASVRIGEEETFEEMDEKYAVERLYHRCNIWWEMETAVDSDEDEESDEDEKEQGAFACLCLNNTSCSIQ